MRKGAVILLAFLLLTGFKWVKLTPEGEQIRVLEKKEVASCKKLGETTASLKAKVGPFDRSTKKVQTELQYLARNSAAADFKDKGADTVVPESDLEEGRQTFAVYRCVNP
jgi:hypothetical protein